MIFLYNLLSLLIALLAIPYYGLVMLLTGKYRKSLGAKMGFGPDPFGAIKEQSPRIWIHAVSVGEVTAAAPIVAALRKAMPEACLVVSTSTETGREMARNIISDATAMIYYPLDFWWVVRKVIRRIRPDIFVMTETELWPNFIHTCHRWGINVVMVNGRISPRSYRRYYGTRFFWRQTLREIDSMGMISTTDAERITAIGMSRERISVLGNAKYDGLAARVSDDLADEIRRRVKIGPDEHVLVAGSTHEGEETVVLRVYGELLADNPDMKLIIVPRHIDRGRTVLELVRSSGYPDCLAMSEINAGRVRRHERILVVDVIGELFKIYSLATVVFCGGSLVPRGGQNILEAAAWGKVVFYGPSMEDFRDEKMLLEGIGAGFPIGSGEDLLRGIRAVMKDPDVLRRKGEAAKAAVAANRGAAEKYASLICETLLKRG